MVMWLENRLKRDLRRNRIVRIIKGDKVGREMSREKNDIDTSFWMKRMKKTINDQITDHTLVWSDLGCEKQC